MPTGPRARYQSRLVAGELRPDEPQAKAAERLQVLHDVLAVDRAEPAESGWGVLGWLGMKRVETAAPPRGVYLYGDVGRGKSMLMDLFYETAPVVEKRRVHFHEFMLEIHRRLHEKRQIKGNQTDPLFLLAADIADETRLLCFDEFHVVNIADAMILGRLFTGLFQHGVVVVATSNWTPDRLYWEGLQRDLFLPFIGLLKSKVDVVALDGPTDFRLERMRDVCLYHHPLGPAANAAIEALFLALADGARGGATEISVGSRRLYVPRAAGGVAAFRFPELCAVALGAQDYLALTERFHTVVLRDVPLLTPDRRNEARRFMTLVDALYERRMILVVSAEADQDHLYATGDGAFEFRRTASRLSEMQSAAWLAKARLREGAIAPADFQTFALTTDLI